MRILYRLIIVFCLTPALAGCGLFSSSEKPHKNLSAAGKEDIMLKIAHATEAGGDLEGAERLYKQAAAQSDSAPAYIELADFYKRQQQDTQAVNALSDALKLQPDNTAIMRELANTYINMGLPDQALSTLNAAIALNTKEAMLYNSRGVALDMLGQYSEAQKSYAVAALYAPDDIVTIKANLSMSYILSGDYDKAIRLLLPLLDSPDASATIRQNLALAYGLKGDRQTALQLGLKDLSPKEAEENLKFYRMLAASHHDNKKGKPAPAIDTPVAAEKPQKVNPVTVTTDVTPITVPPVEVTTPTQAATREPIILPLPVLKPDRP
jgi:Flp pilus assembly protein TadD